MHKKLESDLMSLAHSVLQMKNKENVFLLKQKAHEIYEKLAVLAFVEEYVNSTPGLKDTKESLTAKVEDGYKIKDIISKEIEEVNEVELGTQDAKKSIVALDTEKITAEIGAGSSEEEMILEGVEDKIAEEIGADLETEKVAEIEQPFDDLEGLIFGDAKATGSKGVLKEDGERRGLT